MVNPEEALRIEVLKLESRKRSNRIKCICFDLVAQHLALAIISYAGFLRFCTSKKNLHQTIIMSHVLEFVAQGAPLMLLQMYNNAEQGKWEKPRDPIITMNLAFTILNGINLLVEFILIQLLNPDSEYSVLSKHKIGIVEEGYRNTDSSESEEISSDSSSERQSRGKSRERIQFET